MEKLKRTIMWTKVLLIAAVAAVFWGILALQDIYHNNEPDLRLEWWMVRITFLVIIALIVRTSVLIGWVQKNFSGQDQKQSR